MARFCVRHNGAKSSIWFGRPSPPSVPPTFRLIWPRHVTVAPDPPSKPQGAVMGAVDGRGVALVVASMPTIRQRAGLRLTRRAYAIRRVTPRAFFTVKCVEKSFQRYTSSLHFTS